MKEGKWIWYPGDFEADLCWRFNARRYERDVIIPQMCRPDRCSPTVSFRRDIRLNYREKFYIEADGKFNVMVNGRYLYGCKDSFELEAGRYRLDITVHNENFLPALKLASENVVSDENFLVCCQDRHYVRPATDTGFLNGARPSDFRLPTRRAEFVRVYEKDGRRIYDFGKEIMAFLQFTLDADADVFVCYGESEEEACDYENSLQTDSLVCKKGENRAPLTKGFRYVCIESEASVSRVSALAEYLPHRVQAKLSTGDDLLNRIFDTSMYTLDLNAREYFTDGIKRDRWTWGGDFYQCGLMNLYSFFDLDLYKRTYIALIGKSPVTHYTNHIMDYSFLMLISLREYLEHTGDGEFVRFIYPRAKELAEFCVSRADAERGLIEGREEDWVFIDWGTGMNDNEGAVFAEQVLFRAAMTDMAKIAAWVGDEAFSRKYALWAEKIAANLPMFWDEERGGFIHSIKNGRRNRKFYRQDNVIAILFDGCDAAKKESIVENILFDENVPKIVTPYFKFYEFEALCRMGRQKEVFAQIEDYWGKMLELGATTFWELFDDTDQGVEHYGMYGKKFGKSLCHAWSASPIYLLGRYFMNVSYVNGEPVVGEASPLLGDFEAVLPARGGSLYLQCRNGKYVKKELRLDEKAEARI